MAILLYCSGILMVFGGLCLAMPSSSEDPKILILGAGMSGISAAKTLEDAGYHNIVIIEGSSTIGGRMKSGQISDNTVELGAMWMYGKGTNPIYKLLVDNGMSAAYDFPDSWTVRDSSGTDMTDLADDADARFYAAMVKIDGEGKHAVGNNLSDFSIRSRLRYHNWMPKTPAEKVAEIIYIDYEFGISVDTMSGKHSNIFASFDSFESYDQVPIKDQRGYKHIVEVLAEPLMQRDSTRFVFNEFVKQINQTTEGVEILTDSGKRYQGDYVIVTFSLGVLQNDDVSFSPVLPPCKQLAIDKFEIAFFTQIYLQFAYVFWDDTAMIMSAPDDRGKYDVWVNMNYLIPGSNILQLSVWGDESKRVELLTEDVLKAEIIQHLRTMYPNSTIPSPTNFTMSKWTYDPLYRGAYSYWPTSCTETDKEDIKLPFGRVSFAGEHLASLYYGFVHGAYLSGIETANDMIQCFHDSEACPPSINSAYQCSHGDSMEDTNQCASIAAFVAGSPVFIIALISCLNLLRI